MITKLEGPLRREIAIDGEPYVVTISPDGLLLTQKGRRKGYEMDWRAFVSGETALATALNASLAGAPRERRVSASRPEPVSKAPAGKAAKGTSEPAPKALDKKTAEGTSEVASKAPAANVAQRSRKRKR